MSVSIFINLDSVLFFDSKMLGILFISIVHGLIIGLHSLLRSTSVCVCV
jgi:hypothetical protein